MGKTRPGAASASVPTLTLEQFADALTAAPDRAATAAPVASPSRRPAHPTGGKHAKLSAPVDASSDATAAPRPSIARWARDACVLLLRFPSAAAQRDALGRASVFLEDLDDASRVVDRLPSGQRGGVANYSGHNMRLGDLARFDAACRAANKPLWPAERALVEALVDAGALAPRDATGALRVADRRPGFEPCVAAVARSSDKAEVRDALLHEAMHMVFYRDERYAARCLEWWRSEATDAERDAWIAFLRNLRYDVANEELVVNELQAYMCTERAMFGGFGGFGENKGGVGSGGGGGGGGGGGVGGDAAAVRGVRRRAVGGRPERRRERQGGVGAMRNGSCASTTPTYYRDRVLRIDRDESPAFFFFCACAVYIGARSAPACFFPRTRFAI